MTWTLKTGLNQLAQIKKAGKRLDKYSIAAINNYPRALCKVRMAMDAEVCGGTKTGMNAHKDEKGRLCFTHTYALLVGRKATI